MKRTMPPAVQRVISAVAAGAVLFLFSVAAQAQTRWVKAAPFPQPEEELYGIAAGGKMYVMGGFGQGGKPTGMVWEYDAASDKFTKKKDMQLPVHHQAMAEYRGKIYVFGGFQYLAPQAGAQGGGGWEPVNNSWEYDPVADSWKALAPMPGKRGSAIANEVGGKIYVIGGSIPASPKEAAVMGSRTSPSVGTNEVYDIAANKWETRTSMPTPRNHMFGGVVNGKVYIIGGRIGHSFITVADNTDVVEEYDPATDSWGPSKARMPTARSGGGWATYQGKIYVAGGEIQTPQMLGAFRALEAYDPASNSWALLPAMPIPRHGVAGAFLGNKLHLVSGKITSGGAPDVTLSTGSHDVLEIQ